MSALTNKATIQTSDKRRITQAFWLGAVLFLPSIAAASDSGANDSAKTTTAETNGDTRLRSNTPIPPLSDGTLAHTHTKGLSREAPEAKIPAVILWDEAKSIRRTGSGQPIPSQAAPP